MSALVLDARTEEVRELVEDLWSLTLEASTADPHDALLEAAADDVATIIMRLTEGAPERRGPGLDLARSVVLLNEALSAGEERLALELAFVVRARVERLRTGRLLRVAA